MSEMSKDAKVTGIVSIRNLSEPESELLRMAALEIRGSLHQAGVSLFKAGVALRKVKSLLGHGQFGSWLEREFVCSVRTAQNLMRLATIFDGKYAEFAYLPQKTLLSLASPSTPDDCRDKVTQQVTSGDRPTSTWIEDQIKEARLARKTRILAGVSASTARKTLSRTDAASPLETSSAMITKEVVARVTPVEPRNLSAELSRALPPIIRALKERDAACERLVALTIHRIRKTEIRAYIRDLQTMGLTNFADALAKADAERIEQEFRANQRTWPKSTGLDESLN